MSQAHAEDGAGGEEQTLGQLVATAERDIVHLVRTEIDLAKMEITADLKRGGVSGGLLGGAGFFIYVSLLFLSVAAALAIGLAIPAVLGFLIIGALYLLLAVMFALVGLRNVRKLNKAELTRKSLHDILSLFRRGRS